MARITATSSLGWAHYTLYEALPRIKARGFRRVEIASFYSYCFHFNFGSPTPSELKQMLADLKLEPVCLNYCGSKQEAWHKEEIDRFVGDWTRKLEHVADVGIPMMTMLFGTRNDRPDQEAQLANSVEAYDRVGEAAARFGIRMLLEVPHLWTIIWGPEQVLWVMERLSSDNVGALVDSSHWGISGYDLDAFFDELGDRLWHVHLRDSQGPDKANWNQDLELTPGKGSVDFGKFARTLDRVGYAGDVSLDFEYRDMTLDGIEREYDAGLEYLVRAGWEVGEGVKY